MSLLKKLVNNRLVNNVRFSSLLSCNINNTPKYGYNNHELFGKILRVYDGDTLWIAAKLPESKHYCQLNCRMFGYDAPEMKPSKSLPNRETHIKNAIAAKIELSNYLDSIVKVRIHKFDKYGRFLVTIWKLGEEKSVNQQMIEKGFAYEYYGGTKKNDDELDLKNDTIIDNIIDDIKEQNKRNDNDTDTTSKNSLASNEKNNDSIV
jgi:endonuclease YncB( thermonuclease family)